MVGKVYVSWDELSSALLTKYDKQDFRHVIGSYNKLRQIGSLTRYIDTFEDLRASMLEFNPIQTETHFLHNFISGLHEEIRHNVVMFKPQTLDEVYELVENVEKKLEALRRRTSYTRGSNSTTRPVQTKTFRKPNPELKIVVDSKTNKPTSDFKKGQCFQCGDKWAPGQQCKTWKLHRIEGELPKEDTDKDEIIAEASLGEGDNEGKVTLNAITCHSPPSTLKLTANIKNEEI